MLSPRASIEEEKSRAYIGGGSEGLFRDGKLEICLSRKASIEGAKSRAYIGGGPKAKTHYSFSLEMESPKLFQVPKPL